MQLGEAVLALVYTPFLRNVCHVFVVFILPGIELPPSLAKPSAGDAAEPAVGGDASGRAPDSGRATVRWGTSVSLAGLQAYFFARLLPRWRAPAG